MSTLTPNRILQKGDQYRNAQSGEWMPIPKDEFGMQVMFSKFKGLPLRRPSEISPDSGLGGSPKPAAKAEGNQSTPASSCSGAGGSPAEWKQDEPMPWDRKEIERAGLPTVISTKAHSKITGLKITVGKPGVYYAPPVMVDGTIKFPGLGAMSAPPIWTGRNGTFDQYGLEMSCLDGKVMLFPIGKRGVGNCTIQFPTSVIPQIIDWLQKQPR